MTNEERKELAIQIANELRKDEKYGECRLFSRDQADSLRNFANHWQENKDSYYGLVEFGHSLVSFKQKALFSLIGLAIFGFIVFAVVGVIEKIKEIIH